MKWCCSMALSSNSPVWPLQKQMGHGAWWYGKLNHVNLTSLLLLCRMWWICCSRLAQSLTFGKWLFTHLFTSSDSLHAFVQVLISIGVISIQPEEHPSSTDPLVRNAFRFYGSKKAFISSFPPPLFLKGIVTGYRILSWKIFSTH